MQKVVLKARVNKDVKNAAILGIPVMAHKNIAASVLPFIVEVDCGIGVLHFSLSKLIRVECLAIYNSFDRGPLGCFRSIGNTVWRLLRFTALSAIHACEHIVKVRNKFVR